MKAYYTFFLYLGSKLKLQVSHGPVSSILNNCSIILCLLLFCLGR